MEKSMGPAGIQSSELTRTPTRVLLLGGHGFIGAAIGKRFAEMGLSTVAPASSELNLAEPSSALSLSALMRPSDVVIMLAAVTPEKGRTTRTVLTNIAMMQTVCEALNTVGCEHLLYFSSDAVYDPAVETVSEETPPSPQDLYGAMHYTRELMARSLPEIPVLVVRPTLIYGAGDTHNSYGANRFRRMAGTSGKITLFGAGEEMRDHVYIDDIARLTVECVFHRTTGTLNVATGVSYSFSELADVVARQFITHVAIECTPRVSRITHRRYVLSNLIRAFPDFSFTPLTEGLAAAQRAETLHGAAANV